MGARQSYLTCSVRYTPLQVAVADNENALISALALVRPQCQAHLCRWHIAKNIASSCEKPRMQREAFKALMKGCNPITKTADSEPEFLERWNRFNGDLIGGGGNEVRAWLQPARDVYTAQCLLNAFRYIDLNKTPLRHRFASFAIGQHRHFANTSTSRAEGAHWTSIKCNLRRARGTLLEVYDQIGRSTKQGQHMIEDQIARESVEVRTLPSHVFEPVLRTVTHYALKIVHNEYKKALHPKDLRVCTQYHERVMGLPCAHKLMRTLHEGAQLSTTGFHPHWHKVGAIADPDIYGVLNPYRVEQTRGRPTKSNNFAARINNPDRAHHRKTKRHPSSFEVCEAKKSRAPRKCGNFFQPGHNKRRCPHPLPPGSTDC